MSPRCTFCVALRNLEDFHLHYITILWQACTSYQDHKDQPRGATLRVYEKKTSNFQMLGCVIAVVLPCSQVSADKSIYVYVAIYTVPFINLTQELNKHGFLTDLTKYIAIN